jgi:hypothetical protein
VAADMLRDGRCRFAEIERHPFSGDVFPATFGIGGRVQVLSQEDLTRHGE